MDGGLTSDAGRAVIDFNPGDDVEERKLVIKSGLKAADWARRSDAAGPLKEPSTWHEDAERKREMIEPAAGVDAEIKTGPAEFGGRRWFKNRGFVLEGKSAARAAPAPTARAPSNKSPAIKLTPWRRRAEALLVSCNPVRPSMQVCPIVQVLLASRDLERHLRKWG